MEYPDWEGTPNCRSVDPNTFFTPENSSTYGDIVTLKRICGNCEIQKQCLDYALKHEVMGFWSSTTEYERKKIRKQLNIIPQPLYLGYP